MDENYYEEEGDNMWHWLSTGVRRANTDLVTWRTNSTVSIFSRAAHRTGNQEDLRNWNSYFTYLL